MVQRDLPWASHVISVPDACVRLDYLLESADAQYIFSLLPFLAYKWGISILIFHLYEIRILYSLPGAQKLLT